MLLPLAAANGHTEPLPFLPSPCYMQATAYWTVSNVLAASPGISAGRCCLRKRTVKWSFVGADLFALM